MNIYDKAHEFAKNLKETDEVKSFREAAKKIESNDSSKKMLDDFRKIQFEAYSEQVEKGDISNVTKEKMQKLGSVISMNPDIACYLQAEARFGQLWEDIMKIIYDAVDVDMNYGIDSANKK